MKGRLLGVLVLAAGLCGCEASSATQVTRESIVSPPPDVNLLVNLPPISAHTGSASLADQWSVHAPPGVTDAVRIGKGLRVLTISNPGQPVNGRIFVIGVPKSLPDTAVGATYVLTERVRLSARRRTFIPELKLIYAGGSYRFVGPQHITGPSRGWVNVRIKATAAHRLTSVIAFALDSRPRPGFSGSVSIESPQLNIMPAR